MFSRRAFLSGMLAAAAAASTASRLIGQTAAAASTATSPPAGNFLVRTPNGLMLAAQAQGDPAAPEILLIHGLGQCHLIWERQLRAPALAGYRLVSFDLRGHGDSDKPTDEAAYTDGTRWGDDVAAVIAAAALRRPVLVGWSLGGPVILNYLLKHGGTQVAGLNLVNAVTHFGADLLRPEAIKFARGLGSDDLAVRSQAIAEFLEGCFASPPPPDEFKRMLAFNGMVPRVVQRSVGKISDAGYDEVLSRFDGPLLVTFGAKDRHLFPKMAERVHDLNPRAQLSIYPESGHSPFYENPSRFNQELAKLVDGTVKSQRNDR